MNPRILSHPDTPAGPVPRISIVRKLALLVGLTLALLLAVLLAGSWLYWRAVLRHQVDAHLGSIAASRRDMVQAEVALLLQRAELNTDRGEMRSFLSALADDKPLGENRKSSQLSLERISNGQPIVAATLADSKGTVVLSTDEAEVGSERHGDEEFKAGLVGPYLGQPHRAGERFEATLAAPIRMRSDPQRIHGVLLATADLSRLTEALRDVTGLGQTGEAILGVRDGDEMRFLFPPRNSPQTTVVPLASAPALEASTGGVGAFFRNRDYRGVPVLAVGRPIGYGGWALVVKMDEKEAYAPIARALRYGLLFGLLVAAAGVAAASALARSFTRPVRDLARAAARIAGGHYDVPVTVTSADELGALSTSFNEMTAAIRVRSSERDEAEQALRASEERSRQIAESLPQLVWTCNAEGACDYLGPQWVEYTGLPAALQFGAGWLAQVHPDDREPLMTHWQAAVRSGGRFDVEFRIRRHDGVHRWFRTRAAPLKDEQGRVVKWFGTNTDIDDAKRAEEALRENDRRKDEFLAMLGHELRNPLSAIANAVRLGQGAPGDPEVAALAHAIIQRQTGNLSRHVDDLLDVVRISAGKIELRRQPVQVGETIQRAVETVRTLLEEKHQALELQLAEGPPRRIDADPTRIEQIVTNLLINAARYTPDGGRIVVTESYAGSEVVVTVRDNGIGISPAVLPQIFELFMQGDQSLHRAAGGLGIGLNLCRQLVELHGGSISAQSEGEGCGAEFTVRLPALRELAPVAPPIVPASHTGQGRRCRILLVDDNEDTVLALSQLLVRCGHEVATAADGVTALDVAHAFRPEVLLLDLGLPGLDGYTLARRLRENGFARATLIALSGYAQEKDRVRSRAAGFDHHFAKPVDFDALAELLAKSSTGL